MPTSQRLCHLRCMQDNVTIPASKLIRALGRLREIHHAMTVLQVQHFLHIAANPGITQSRICQDLDSNDAARTLGLLSEYGDPGLELIKMKLNPDDPRERFLYLTLKGRHLMDDIVKDLAAPA